MVFLRSLYLRSLPEGDQFPFNLPLIKNLDEVSFSSPVTFFVGENGSGKSTLMEAIATGMEAITIGSHDVWEDPTLEAARALGDRLRLIRNKKPHRGFYFRAEDAFGFTKRIIQEQQALEEAEQEMMDSVEGSGKDAAAGVIRAQRMKLVERYGDDPDACSHGESFLNVLKERMTPDGFYLLDEPETPLSPMRQIALLYLIHDHVMDGSQFIIATHSPILMAYPKARILLFDEGEIREISYDDVEHVTVTRSFLNNPAAYLRHLED